MKQPECSSVYQRVLTCVYPLSVCVGWVGACVPLFEYLWVYVRVLPACIYSSSQLRWSKHLSCQFICLILQFYPVRGTSLILTSLLQTYSTIILAVFSIMESRGYILPFGPMVKKERERESLYLIFTRRRFLYLCTCPLQLCRRLQNYLLLCHLRCPPPHQLPLRKLGVHHQPEPPPSLFLGSTSMVTWVWTGRHPTWRSHR